jgi:hypothetical protein
MSTLGTLSGQIAPVALFVYNRPEHTRRTVEALRANDLAHESNLYVFADGAKNEPASAAVEAVRKFIRTIDGFRSVTIFERDQNFGLANSVIAGVTRMCDEHGRVIVMEDDLLTTPDFLLFINRALEHYADVPKVFSVSGFNFAVTSPPGYPFDTFLAYRSSSWGWGTWKDRWSKADWSVSDYCRFHSDKQIQRMFNRGGEDLSRMLAWQMSGKIDSWAIRWAYAHFKHDAVTVLPMVSKVLNIGMDGSGVHTRQGAAKQSALVSARNTEYRFPDSLVPNPRIVAEIQRMSHISSPRKIAQYLRDKLRRKRTGASTVSNSVERPVAVTKTTESNF